MNRMHMFLFFSSVMGSLFVLLAYLKLHLRDCWRKWTPPPVKSKETLASS